MQHLQHDSTFLLGGAVLLLLLIQWIINSFKPKQRSKQQS